MYSQRGAAQYQSVRNHGLVADASPTRLVQVMFEQILAQLAIAQGCMGRIENNLPLTEVVAKGKAIGKAVRLIDQLNASLDMERGQQIAENLRALYVYMLARLTLANLNNDAAIVVEVSGLVQKIKTGWDQIVAEGR
ncbi:MAG: flagellar secretion chaperone FliS [Gammaproteobacteria bacterium]|jgi:flagellar protein FliS|nr:flagellar secretion chaperone FliS [Gammaproteobacteria bacterium]